MTARGLALAALLAAAAARGHDGPAAELARLSAAIDAAPADPGLRLRRAAVLRRAGRHSQALADARAAGASARASLETGLALAALGDPAGAEVALDAALASLDDPAGLWARARLRAARKDAGGAIRDYRRAGKLAPAIDLFLEEAALLDDAGAAAACTRGLARFPSSSVLRVELARIEARRGRHHRALEALAPLVAAAQVKTRWLLRQADIHALAGRPDLAARDRALALDEAERALSHRGSADRLVDRALCHRALGRDREAEADLRRALEQSPGLDEARRCLEGRAACRP